EDGIRDFHVTGVQTCALPIYGNGAYDQGDLTLSGWMIQLKQGGTVTTTFTDENGAYSFDGLDLGTYTICEVQQPKWAQTYPAKRSEERRVGKECRHRCAKIL